MCGHASIGICAMLVETGRVDVVPLHTVVRLETPMGIVEGTVPQNLIERLRRLASLVCLLLRDSRFCSAWL